MMYFPGIRVSLSNRVIPIYVQLIDLVIKVFNIFLLYESGTMFKDLTVNGR